MQRYGLGNEHCTSSSSSQDNSEASNTDLDRGKSCLELNDGNDLGSPCISINTRSFDDFNLPCGVDYNINEVLGEFGDYEDSHQNDNTGLEVVFKENELIDDRSPTTSVNSIAEHIVDNDNDFDDNMEDELVCANSVKIKNLKKKKKRKNYKWSRKKIRSTIKLQFPSSPKFSIEDTCIPDTNVRVEAIKTLEVAKLLGLSFFDEDELIINRMMDLELEEQSRHKCIQM